MAEISIVENYVFLSFAIFFFFFFLSSTVAAALLFQRNKLELSRAIVANVFVIIIKSCLTVVIFFRQLHLLKKKNNLV